MESNRVVAGLLLQLDDPCAPSFARSNSSTVFDYNTTFVTDLRGAETTVLQGSSLETCIMHPCHIRLAAVTFAYFSQCGFRLNGLEGRVTPLVRPVGVARNLNCRLN